MEIKFVLEIIKLVYLEYIVGKYSKNDVIKLFGRLRDFNIKLEIRKIKFMEIKFIELKFIGNLMK